MTLDLITIYLILLLGMVTVLFWLWFLIKVIISKKIKLPFVWGLYFSISYTFFFSKSIITDSATERTFSIIGKLFLLMLCGTYRWWSVKCHGKLLKKAGVLEY